MSKALIIDSSYLIFRSYFAYPHLNNKEFPTGSFYGFCKAVLKMVKDLQPTYLYFAKDLPSPTWRHKIFEEYKGGRREPEAEMIQQIPVIHKWSSQVGSGSYSLDGYEADDIIKTIACRLETDPEIDQVIIFSADRDLYQILNQSKVVFTQLEKLFTKQDFMDKYGVDPEQWVDFKALVGDASDNLKGVDKIGPKTAAWVLNGVGSLDKLFAHIASPQGYDARIEQWLVNKKNQEIVDRIQDDIDKVILNQQLSMLNNIDELAIAKDNFDLNKGRDMFEEYKFPSLIKDLENMGKSFAKAAKPKVQIQSESLF